MTARNALNPVLTWVQELPPSVVRSIAPELVVAKPVVGEMNVRPVAWPPIIGTLVFAWTLAPPLVV